jgi:hypothetical protein
VVRAMIQYQLRMEDSKPYSNQAHRHVINDCLMELRKEGGGHSGVVANPTRHGYNHYEMEINRYRKRFGPIIGGN